MFLVQVLDDGWLDGMVGLDLLNCFASEYRILLYSYDFFCLSFARIGYTDINGLK